MEPVRYDISYYLPDIEPIRYDISYYLPDIEPVRYDIISYLRVDPWALRLYRRLYSGAEGWYNLNAHG